MIKVLVTPGAKKPRVTKTDETSYEVRVDARAEGGRANKRLIEILADYFDVPKSSMSIVHGERSREKVIKFR